MLRTKEEKKKYTDEEVMVFLKFKNAEEFRKAYLPEYLDKLAAFINEADHTLYDHYFNNGTIKFTRRHPDYSTLFGKLILANKCVQDMYTTDFLYYDMLTPKEKMICQDGFYIAEMNFARMGKAYGY